MSDDGRIWIGGLAGLALAATLVRRGSPLRRIAPEPEIGWEFADGVWFLDHLGITWRVEPTTHAPTRFRDPPSPGSPVRWAALRLDGVIGAVKGCLRRRVGRVRYHEGCRDHEFKTADDARGAVETYLGLGALPSIDLSLKRRGSSLRRVAPKAERPEEIRGEIMSVEPVREDQFRVVVEWDEGDFGTWMASSHDFGREPRSGDRVRTCPDDQFVYPENRRKKGNPKRGSPLRETPGSGPTRGSWLAARGSSAARGSTLRRVAPAAEPEPEPSRFAWIGLDEGPDADLTLEHETGWWDIVRSVHRPRPSGPARFGGWTIHSPVPHVGFVRGNGPFGKGKSKVFKTREEAVRVAEEVLTEIETRSGNRKRGSPLRRVAPEMLPPWDQMISFTKEALAFHGTGALWAGVLNGGLRELEEGRAQGGTPETVDGLYRWMFGSESTRGAPYPTRQLPRWRWIPFCLLMWSFLLTKVKDPDEIVARPGWSCLEARRALLDRAQRFATQIRTTGHLEAAPGIANDLSLIRVGLERHPSASKDERVATWVIPGLLALRDALRAKGKP